MRPLLKLLPIIAVLLVLFILLRPLFVNDNNEVRAQLTTTSPPTTGFARADGPRPFAFPADHGPHAAYQ